MWCFWRNRRKKEGWRSQNSYGGSGQTFLQPQFTKIHIFFFGTKIFITFYFSLVRNWNQGHANFRVPSTINSQVLHRCIFMYTLLQEQTAKTLPQALYPQLSTHILSIPATLFTPLTPIQIPTSALRPQRNSALPTSPSLTFS